MWVVIKEKFKHSGPLLIGGKNSGKMVWEIDRVVLSLGKINPGEVYLSVTQCKKVIMEFKGTKGKWRIMKRASLNVESESGHVVASCGARSSNTVDLHEELSANANFIAAAPEMLEALELIMSISMDHAVIRIANKVIKKALDYEKA